LTARSSKYACGCAQTGHGSGAFSRFTVATAAAQGVEQRKHKKTERGQRREKAVQRAAEFRNPRAGEHSQGADNRFLPKADTR